jgi:hypothetical protein
MEGEWRPIDETSLPSWRGTVRMKHAADTLLSWARAKELNEAARAGLLLSYLHTEVGLDESPVQLSRNQPLFHRSNRRQTSGIATRVGIGFGSDSV